MPNQQNQKLVSFNYERIRHWMGYGAHITEPVAELLGLAGFFPMHPNTYKEAWRNRAAARKAKEESEAQQAADTEPST